MNCTIRIATADDAALLATLNDDVQKLHADALPHFFKQPSVETFPVTKFTEAIAEPNHTIFLAEVNGVAVGYLMAEVRHRPESAMTFAFDSIMVDHISVQPAFHRQGIGEALIGAVKALAHEKNIATVTLDTWAFNQNAQAFFAQQGFTVYNYRLWMAVPNE